MSNILILQENPKFQQFRFRLPNGEWHIVKETIKTPQDLQEQIDIHTPTDCYGTTSRFINPQDIRGRKKSSYKTFPIILSNLVFIDVDVGGPEGSEEVKKIIDWFKDKPRYQFYKLVHSGRGFHIYFKDTLTDNTRIADPKERFNFIKTERQKLQEEMKIAGLHFDPWIDDLFRVTRVIGTENSKSNTFSREISPLEIDDIQSSNQSHEESQTKSQRQIRPPELTFFVSNQVPGIKGRYIPVLFLRKEGMVVLNKPNLKLGRVYLFDLGGVIMAIGLKTFDKTRIGWLLRKTHSLNQLSWEKYGHCWLHLAKKIITDRPASEVNIPKGNLLQVVREWAFEKPKFIGTIDNGPITYYASRSHLKPLSWLVGQKLQYPLQHGSEAINTNIVMRAG